MPDTSWLPALLQLSDSTLPVGAYAHSFGLEGLVQMGAVTNIDDLERFLTREMLSSLSEVELPLIRHSRAALESNDLAAVTRLDHLALATRPTAELRSASTRMGRQLLNLAPQLLGEELTESPAWQLVLDSIPHRQTSTATAVLHHFRKVPSNAGLHATTWQTLSGLAQAGLKLLHLGPAGIQGILARCSEAIPTTVAASISISEAEIGSFTPLWDIASSRHQRAPARLFIS
ncbi:urease accessory protein UreF [Haloferula chungangensis]|uniref:Urease accessory protein UreF n=1 Tax=Haloferula chungangensis TaxID=1048331 RepID=A0ABW2LBA3_9BACT